MRSSPQRKIVRVKYDFPTLFRWYEDHVLPLSTNQVVLTDIAESKNKIVVGVRHVNDIEGVRSILLARGVPDDALIVQREEPVLLQTTLSDSIRPILAGMEIGRQGMSRGCSLGFALRLFGSSTTYFATASHCTAQQGYVDSATWWQPLYYGSPSGGIGTEQIEADWWYCFQLCTYADIALVGPASVNDYSFGRIARTTWAGTNGAVGSDTISSTYPNGWQIVGVDSWPVEGQYAHKVGRTTGWTWGDIYQTCVHISQSGPGGPTGWKAYCSYRANYFSSGGDSGSPVFVPVGTNTVNVLGIHWGSGGTFSAFGGMEIALGTLTLY